MELDISRTPFSKYGSYLSIAHEPEHKHLLIRNVRQKWGAERLIAVTFQQAGAPATFEVAATPYQVTVTAGSGRARFYLRHDTGLAVAAEGVDVTLSLLPEQNGFGFAHSDTRLEMVSVLGDVYCTLDVERGRAVPRFLRTLSEGHHTSPVTEARIEGAGGQALAHLRVSTVETNADAPPLNVDADVADVRADWERFLSILPPVPDARRPDAELAWYTLWSSFVRAEGNFEHDTALMSKGWMTALWSWDHCFNAMAIARTNLKVGIEQFLAPFACQRASGVLPDYMMANETLWTVVKPPIHGWCIQRILSHAKLDFGTVRRIYDHLSKWTDWWFEYRDSDRDGVPNYLQGIDSGWDNATVFDLGIGVEAPDLSAYLVLQMDALADLATAIGDRKAAGAWRQRADELLANLYKHSWSGDGFVAKVSRTHEHAAKSTSLLALMPLVLGDLLDKPKFDLLAARLERDFLTEHGLATECPSSPEYRSNGYWRGPIWAPATYLLVDGLNRGGRRDLAVEIARRFCDMVHNAGGNYENFDAMTGEGLCEPGYTWTASVNLLLMHEYLREDKRQ